MRLSAVCALVLFLPAAVIAQLTPGFVVRSGEPFPIVADFNGDGLDDLIQEKTVILNDGTSLVDVRDLGLPAEERVVAVLDVNADHRLDLITEERSLMAPPSVPQSGPRWARYRLYIAGSSRPYSTAIDLDTGMRPYAVDSDGDGRDEILTITPLFGADHRSIGTDITLVRWVGDGNLASIGPFRLPDFPQLEDGVRVLSGDIDKDGITDLVMRCPEDLIIFHGAGSGKFEIEDRYLPMSLNWGWWSWRLADIDGDSNLDIVMPVQRGARVLFGDGRGNFPRTAMTRVARLHEAIGLPAGVPIDVGKVNQPRDLAIGHFTRTDRDQIAAGMAEGDLVVLSYDSGALKEVSRTQTEFWGLDIRSGAFRRGGLDDLYVMGTLIWGDMYPPPRVFFGNEDVTRSNSSARRAERRRASRTPAQVAFNVQVSSECMDTTAQRWVFARDGVFGISRSDDTAVDAVFDGSLIYVRLRAPYANPGVTAVLTAGEGVYRGTTTVLTSCGWKAMTITATPD